MAQLGGKGASLVWLRAARVPVPKFLVVPFSRYSEHLDTCGIDPAVLGVLVENILSTTETTISADHKRRLAEVRDKITSTPLLVSLQKEVQAFIASSKNGVSVRSSASNEDGSECAFAGQYETILNCNSDEEVFNAVRECWASMWSEAVFIFRRNIEKRTGVHDVDLPLMALVVQDMVHPVTSGVAFSSNMEDLNHTLIESVFGLGQGLVDGQVMPDRFVVRKSDLEVVTSDLGDKEKQVIGDPSGGTQLVDLDVERRGASSLSDEARTKLCELVKIIEDKKGRPQDIEWAVDADGKVWILQTRDITTINLEAAEIVSALKWELPVQGGGDIDSTHWSKMGTAMIREHYVKPFEEGMKAGFRETGSFLEYLEMCWVNGFCYMVPRPVGAPKNATAPPPWFIFKILQWVVPELRARYHKAKAYWSEKGYLKRLKIWDEEERPVRITDTIDLIDQVANTAKLSTKEQGDLFERLVEHWIHGVHLHHINTAHAIVVPGHLLSKVHEWTGVPRTEILMITMAKGAPARGASDPVFKDFFDALRKDKKLSGLIQDTSSDWNAILKQLHSLPGKFGEDFQFFWKVFAWRGSNYDLPTPTIFESENILRPAMRSALDMTPEKVKQLNAKSDKLLNDLRAKVPEAHLEEFDDVIKDCFECYRLRDERSLFGDLWSVGVIRQFLHAIGKALKLNDPDILLFCTTEQVRAIFSDGKKLQKPSDETMEYARREQLVYNNIEVSHPVVPRSLGPKGSGPPPNSWYPQYVVTTEAAVGEAMFGEGGVFGPPPKKKTGPNVVSGTVASYGRVKGRACVIHSMADAHLMEDGDILVCGSTSSSFNAVIGRASGIISGAGGALCHAGICAREIGLPALVGCGEAMSNIKHGDIVDLNAENHPGVATIVKRA